MKVKRRKSRVIKVGNVKIGGNNSISIQGMSKIDTENTLSVVNEIKKLEKAGCELVRVAVKSKKSANNLKKIKKKINIPLIADIHFDYRLALYAIENGADKIRINPGNLSKKEHLKEIINEAKKVNIPIRIGLNSGSVPFKYNKYNLPAKIVNYALKCIRLFEDSNFYDIIVSLKTSDVTSTIEANRLIAKKVKYPLHLGVTATGLSYEALAKSALGIGTLLIEGIGDTIRVSLTSSSEKEIEAAKSILQALDIRRFSPEIISCPTCGRCQVNLIKEAEGIKKALDEKVGKDKRLLLLNVAVMGCEVNGPGEAKHADIGVACGKNYAILFKKGRIIRRIKAKDIKRELLKEIK